jgi:hypothetical protein
MAFSFSRLIIFESDRATSDKAFKLTGEYLPQATQRGTASCDGEIDNYKIWLGFWKGIPSWKCSCTQTLYSQSKNPCVHAIALAFAWDRNRGIPDPTVEDITFLTQVR